MDPWNLHPDWKYTGDMNLTSGGTFWKHIEGDDFAEAVEIVPHTDVNGPDTDFWLITGTIYLPEDASKRRSILATCGYAPADRDGAPGIVDGTGAWFPWDSVDARTMWVDACKAYGGFDDMHDRVLRIGAPDPDYDPAPVVERAEITLPEGADLAAYVRDNYLA